MQTAYRRCCGIDVHKKSVVVYVLPPQGQSEGKALEREFRTFSRDLRRLRGWLKSCRVTEVVMESTGQYWRAVWNILEDEIPRLVLVNPTHVKALAGRKTDRIDSKRLAQYLQNRELDGSFVPPRPIRELRDLTRLRVHLLEEVNRVKNRIGQMCEAGNIKVSSVASDLFGLSGRRMLEAIIEGKRDAGWMADYARGVLRSKKRELEEALDGTFTDHQRWMLRSEMEHLERLEGQIERVNGELDERMQPYQESIRRLDTIPGVDRIIARTIVAELGTDMTVFPDADHSASWSGMCPGNRMTGGRRKSGKTRKANPYLRRDLCQAAWAATRKQDSYLAAMYRRQRGHLGHQKAIFALAHQILRIAYTMLKRGEDYREMGGDYYERRNKPKTVHRLVERLSRLGYAVYLEELPENASPSIAPATPTTEAAAMGPARPPTSRRRGRPCKCAERGIVCAHGPRNSEAIKIENPDNTST